MLLTIIFCTMRISEKINYIPLFSKLAKANYFFSPPFIVILNMPPTFTSRFNTSPIRQFTFHRLAKNVSHACALQSYWSSEISDSHTLFLKNSFFVSDDQSGRYSQNLLIWQAICVKKILSETNSVLQKLNVFGGKRNENEFAHGTLKNEILNGVVEKIAMQ